MGYRSLTLAGALGFALVCLAGAQPALAQQVGVTGAVNPASNAVSGGNVRVLELGSPIIHNERLRTSAVGSLQIVFLDRTTLSVGPSSDIVIDSFVYDPARQRGKMIATLGKGVLRVVGGDASHTDGLTVNTPVATIAIRGGVATVSHDPKKGTQAIDHFGEVRVASRGVGGRVQ